MWKIFIRVKSANQSELLLVPSKDNFYVFELKYLSVCVLLIRSDHLNVRHRLNRTVIWHSHRYCRRCHYRRRQYFKSGNQDTEEGQFRACNQGISNLQLTNILNSNLSNSDLNIPNSPLPRIHRKQRAWPAHLMAQLYIPQTKIPSTNIVPTTISSGTNRLAVHCWASTYNPPMGVRTKCHAKSTLGNVISDFEAGRSGSGTAGET